MNRDRNANEERRKTNFFFFLRGHFTVASLYTLQQIMMS